MLRFGSQKYHKARTFSCKKIVKKLLRNIFKTILKVIRWSKLPTFTVVIHFYVNGEPYVLLFFTRLMKLPLLFVRLLLSKKIKPINTVKHAVKSGNVIT